MNLLHSCTKCVVYNPVEQKCGLLGHKITNPDKFSCGFYTTEFTPCSLCGQNLMGFQANELYCEQDKTFVVCENCREKISTCLSCSHARFCEFETSSNPLPKIVQKVITQGNLHQIIQMRNPERVEACCPGCQCWSEKELRCLREDKTCEKYIPSWRVN